MGGINEINYKADGEVVKQFLKNWPYASLIRGPVGSGKSAALVIKILMAAMQQKPSTQDGIRKTRFAVVRRTNPQLKTTTIKTWLQWVPENGPHGKFIWTPPYTHHLKFAAQDGTTVDCEVIFMALDRPSDIDKLLSLELTGVVFNEAREMEKNIIDVATSRVGRYPKQDEGGPTWFGILLDTNAPDSDHWWYKLFETACPDSYALFKQPSGLSENAENINNLPKGYYINMQEGKDKEWINVYVHGMYGFVQDGKPVWPEYKDDVHSTAEPIEIDRKKPIIIGIDFGLTPAAVFGQLSAAGRWLIFDELVTEDMGAKNFSLLLGNHIKHNYANCEFEIYGDPAGDQRAQTDEITPFQILATNGIIAWPTYTNDLIIRLESVAATLTRMDFAGNPAFLIGPKAVMCRKALAGGYKYRRMSVTGQERYMDKPDKGRYSHVADALQYLMVGAGEGNNIITTSKSNEPIDYSHTDRMIA